METIYLCIVIILLILACFDIWVGVSNDAVNFLNSAIGSKAASYKAIFAVASIGVFIGASMSNGMMDVARHGIFQPQYFAFSEIMCILMGVIVTDIVLMDVFNSLGRPTSTTVSLVFELLGATVALSLYKTAAGDGSIAFAEMINTDKAFSVILAIFVSVAIAFFFGALVQWLARLVFTFNYKRNLKWFIGIFGGIAATAIVYFMLIKGVKDLSFMTPENKLWVNEHTSQIVLYCLLGFTVLMQILHILKVNVFKVIVLLGTFALAMAFAGNDLVNFIGVPLTGYSSFLDYTANGAGVAPDAYMMDSLNGPANTPIIFLILAGLMMVISLVTSKKSHNVVKTSLKLSRQEDGDEMFGSSPLARYIVRGSQSISNVILNITPPKVKKWVDSRFNQDETIMEEGASFDLVRASVNLVLAGLLVALGTSLKLPLSTTYVTFMVAMGTSLADRAWGRESAVFRITGVISVIGGWFITAGAAFIVSFVLATAMHFGGFVVMILLVALAIVLLIKSAIQYKKKKKEEKEDTLFDKMMSSEDISKVWPLLRQHVTESVPYQINIVADSYLHVTESLINEDWRDMRRTVAKIETARENFKKIRRRELLGLHRADPNIVLTQNTWFHVLSNNTSQLMYSLKRMYEPCTEHLDNNFNPLPDECSKELRPMRDKLITLMQRSADMVLKADYTGYGTLVDDIDFLRVDIAAAQGAHAHRMQESLSRDNINIYTLYMNTLQESGQLAETLKHLLRAAQNFQKV